ncbi:MAG: glycosyltransferase [Candidatus Hermodarchaeota archaeon]
MSEILLSICIPTYKREHILIKTLRENLLECPEKEIQFVICADGPTNKIESKLNQWKDERIILIKSDTRLGIDASIIKSIQVAVGKYIMLMSDEDYIKWDSIKWVLNIISSHYEYTQILGGINYNDKGIIKPYYTFKDKIWQAGNESLIYFFYKYKYLTGLILKKSALNLKKAKKYIGSAYMCSVLSAMAMVNGDTISTSKVFCMMGEPDPNITYITMTQKDDTVKNKSVYIPLSRYFQMHYRKHLIYELTENFPKARKILLKRERAIAAGLLVASFCKSIYSFLKVLPYILRTKEYSLSLNFWISIPKYIFIYTRNMLKNKEDLRFFIRQLINPNESLIILEWPKV